MLAFLKRNQKPTKKLQPLRKKQKFLINHGSTSVRISAETTSEISIVHDILSTEENTSLSQRATIDSEDNVLFSNNSTEANSVEANTPNMEKLVDYKCDSSEWERVCEVLIKKGIKDHFESMIGGEMTAVAVNYLIRRTSFFLSWTHQHSQTLILQEEDVIQWFHTLIVKEYFMVQKYTAKYLSGYRRFTPSTCLNYLNDFTKAINWFIWFREMREIECPIEATEAGGILVLCSKLKKSLKPSLRKQRLSKTLEHLQESGSFPVGGLPELQRALVEDIEWAKGIDELLVRTCFQTYNKFMSVLIAAFYCESPQGRIGGNLNTIM